MCVLVSYMFDDKLLGYKQLVAQLISPLVLLMLLNLTFNKFLKRKRGWANIGRVAVPQFSDHERKLSLAFMIFENRHVNTPFCSVPPYTQL